MKINLIKMIELKLSNGEDTFFIQISENSTVEDLINELKNRTPVNNPQLLYKGEPLDPSAFLSSFNFKNKAKIIYNDKYNGGKLVY
jgi:hypothetical protein